MRAPRLALLAALLAGTLAAGCQRPRDWAARIAVSLDGAKGRPVHGIDLTVALPTGTRIAHDRATGRISAEAIATGQAAASATVDGRFVPHETSPFVRILIASRVPLGDGELAVLSATIRSAITPPRERFEVVRVRVSGPDDAPVPGATAWVSRVELR